AQLMASVPLAMEAAEQASAAANQVSLFDLGDESLQAPLELADEPAWTDKRKLQEEKQALGFYLSGHMFDSYAEEVRRFVRTRIRDLTEGRDRLVAGVISSMRTMMTQRGKMLIVQLDDGTATLEVTIFNEQFEANKHLFKEDELLIVQGNARPDSFTGGLRFTVESLMDLGRARARFARALKLSFNGNADWTRLRATLQPHCTMYRVAAMAGAGGGSRGGGGGFNGGGGGGGGGRSGAFGRRNDDDNDKQNGLPVHIVYRRPDAECESRLGDDWKVQPGDELLGELRQWLTTDSVQIIY
ncbi:MAG: DNA polymerase III subunit alpha, partial [Pandoraea sp.]|nr:DNA polymerase III subunit alpha [Pandoraea sp.]